MSFILRFRNFRSRLLSIGEKEKLSKLSLFVIIVLDFYILSIIFGGLADHTRQLTSPEEAIPYQCHNIFINNYWSKEETLNEIQRLVLADYNNYSYYYESLLNENKINRMNEVCRVFFLKVKAVSKNKQLHALFLKRQNTQKERDKVKGSFNKDKAMYDTSLLQNIANKDQKNLSAVDAKVNTQFKSIQTSDETLLGLEKEIYTFREMQDLWAMIGENSEYRALLKKEYKKLQFIYPVKRIFWQMLFLLPLLAGFYIWNTFSINRAYQVQTFISTHLLGVASIPVVLKILEMVMDLLPRHFFTNIFNFLKRMHLVAVWHYLVIIFSVAGALLLVYIIQKKFFNPERIVQKRLSKGECFSCGVKLVRESIACPFCGAKQQEECNHCGNKTIVAAMHCSSCGVQRKSL